MELGIYSFGEITLDTSGASAPSVNERLVRIIEMAQLAEEGGLDAISLGEHHRTDFAVSAPEVVLASIASVTKRIRLLSGVTVLSSQDPVRVFQQFATLDQISSGRAEIVAGRGAFTESFPLFGYDLNDYDSLFDEKLKLLVNIRDEPIVSWQGQFRPSLHEAVISPRPYQEKLPIWVGIGGTPASAARAGALGLPMVMGFFAGPEQFVPRVEIYHRAAELGGHDPSKLRLGQRTHVYRQEFSASPRQLLPVLLPVLPAERGAIRGQRLSTERL